MVRGSICSPALDTIYGCELPGGGAGVPVLSGTFTSGLGSVSLSGRGMDRSRKRSGLMASGAAVSLRGAAMPAGVGYRSTPADGPFTRLTVQGKR